MSPKALYLVTGECGPKTEGEVRLEYADHLDLMGDHFRAEKYRLIVRRMHEEWEDSDRGRVKRALSKVLGPDPNEVVPPFATPENPMFWHEPRYSATVVCPCGHFAEFLCDEPIGKGKTCDSPACQCCRNQIGDEIDQCRFHAETQPRQAVPV